MQLRDDLETYARSIGIDYLRVTDARPFIREEALLNELLAAQKYPPLAPRDVSIRCHPRQVLPNARAIISVAVSYLSADREPRPLRLHGTVARFARVGDYHNVVADQLARLVAFVQDRVPAPFEYRICVDNGPLLERAVAARAGLGWFGKNGMLYVPRLGSWVVLGEIITDLSLPPHEPVSQMKCGDCRLCQQACPTGALDTPYRVDGTLCLSAVNQTSGQMPSEFRKAMGRRLWGCDTCQTVCPWNRQAEPGDNLWPQGAAAQVDLIQLLTMSKIEVSQSFAGTALGWRGRATLQRNAALVLGNLKDPRAVNPLTDQSRHHPSPVVRQMCAWALGEINARS